MCGARAVGASEMRGVVEAGSTRRLRVRLRARDVAWQGDAGFGNMF